MRLLAVFVIAITLSIGLFANADCRVLGSLRERHTAEEVKQQPRLAPTPEFPCEASVIEALQVLYAVDPNLINKAIWESRWESVENQDKANAILQERFQVGRSLKTLKSGILKYFGRPNARGEIRFAQAVQLACDIAAVPLIIPGRPEILPVPGAEGFDAHPLTRNQIMNAVSTAKTLSTKGKQELNELRKGADSQGLLKDIFRAYHFLRHQVSKVKPTFPIPDGIKEQREQIRILENALSVIHYPLIDFFLSKRIEAMKDSKSDDPLGKAKEVELFFGPSERLLNRCLKRFDPDYGTAFSTYFGRAMYFHVNRIMKKFKAEKNLSEDLAGPSLSSSLKDPEKRVRYESDFGNRDERDVQVLLLNLLEQAEPRALYPEQYARSAEILRRMRGVGTDIAEYAEPETNASIANRFGVSAQMAAKLITRALALEEKMKEELRQKSP